jgi:hypothetical protein
MARGYSKRSMVSFNAGELSPKLDARVDLAKYQNGCRKITNGIIGLYGEVARRPGMEYIASAKNFADVNAKVCLVDFQFSTTTTFTLEFGGGYIRFYSNGVQVTLAGVPYEIASPYAVADIFTVQFAQTNDVAYCTHPNYPVYKLSRLADTNWTMVAVPFESPPLLDENLTDTTIEADATTGTVALLASAAVFTANHVGAYWQISHLRAAAFTQYYIDSGDGESLNLEILGTWNVRTTGVWVADILVQRSTDAGTTWATIRKYSGDEDRNVDAVGEEEEGALYRIKVENQSAPGTPGSTSPRVILEAVDAYIYGLVLITAVTDSTHATATVIKPLFSTDPTKFWSEGAWSKVRGYPRAVTIFEQSLFYGGTINQPQTIWKSVTGDYENFRYGSEATDAIAYTIGSKRQQTVLWMVGQKALLIGTTSGEWAMSGSNDDPITPSNVTVRPQSEHGSAATPGRLIGDVVLFVQRNGRKLRELAYSLERDKYVAPDLTLLAEHITQSGIVQMAVQQLPFLILWCVTNDGRLIGMTYEREQDVVGWHEHVTNGVIESVSVVYGDTDDEVWISVLRNGGLPSQRRSIERFRPFNPINPDDDPTRLHDAFFVDGGKSFNVFPAIGTFSGLDYLNGASVAILADGAVFPNQTVVGGSITLPEGATAFKAQIGIPFTTEIKPMRLDVDPVAGVTQGQVKRITNIFIRLYQSLGLFFGDGVTMQPLSFRDTAMSMDQSPGLFTGEKELEFDGDYSYEAEIVIRQSQPLPMTVLGMTVKYEISGN